MREKRLPDYLLFFMKHLNLMIILFICVMIRYCLDKIVLEGRAEQFLGMVVSVPLETWKLMFFVLGCFISLMLLMSIQINNIRWMYLKILVELIIGMILFCLLNYSYSGIILLILANEIRDDKDLHQRVWMIFIFFICYVLLDYHYVSIVFHVTPVETILSFYKGNKYEAMLAVIGTLKILNVLAFTAFLLALLHEQTSQKALVLKLNKELEEKNEELLCMNQEVEEATKTKERNRLAREIHDTLGHTLTGIITGADACVMIVDIAPEIAKQQLKAIADIARGGIKDVRRSVNALRPDVLEQEDLFSALQKMIESTRLSTGVQIIFDCGAALDCFNKDEEDVIYRIIQEGTTNSIRHGKATEISIKIERIFDRLLIEIRDNGKGCVEIKKGFGIHHMEERLNMLHGTVKYDGSNGFVLFAEVPIRWGQNNSMDEEKI